MPVQEPPQDGRELDAQQPGHCPIDSLIASQGVVQLLAADAVGDGEHRGHDGLVPGAGEAVVVGAGEVEAGGTDPPARGVSKKLSYTAVSDRTGITTVYVMKDPATSRSTSPGTSEAEPTTCVPGRSARSRAHCWPSKESNSTTGRPYPSERRA